MIYGDDGILVCRVTIQEPPEASEEPLTRANGRLIASAPDLLQVAEQAFKYMAHTENEPSPLEIEGFLTEMEAVISKAK
ncbi:hypothetical protein Pan258_02340 [Symmachiella dynata]|nr:hypothetical protein Pan258_02340 [Symmachiella dynata]